MPEGNIRVTKDECKSVKEKFKFLGWPIIRGVVNMIESLILSMKTLTISADAFGIEEEETEKAENTFEFRPVGYGCQDWKKILASAEKAGAEWVVVEQDDPSMGKTPIECAEMSINYLKTL